MFENFDIKKVFDLERIFKGSPGSLFEYYVEFFVIFGLMFFVFIGIAVYLVFEKDKTKKKLLRKFRKLFMWIGFLGLLYLTFRGQDIYLFSSRVMLYLIFLIFFVWLSFILYYYYFKYENEAILRKKKEEIKKYIPKPKKKGSK